MNLVAILKGNASSSLTSYTDFLCCEKEVKNWWSNSWKWRWYRSCMITTDLAAPYSHDCTVFLKDTTSWKRHHDCWFSIPQVATQFKSSLTGLTEILMSKEPWYVRCVKPNDGKQPGEHSSRLACRSTWPAVYTSIIQHILLQLEPVIVQECVCVYLLLNVLWCHPVAGLTSGFSRYRTIRWRNRETPSEVSGVDGTP